MSDLTIIGSPEQFPTPFAAPFIEVAETWEDEWEYDPELTLVSCGLYASSSAISTCEFARRYGNTKEPYETDFNVKAPQDFVGWWIRFSIMTPSGPVPQFVGQVENQSRVLMGSEELASGTQNWIASGGIRLLQKLYIHEAVCRNPDGISNTIGWIPPMNMRDEKRNMIIGNREDDADPDGGYLYGGKSLWTHLQYLNYLITNFIQQYDDDDNPVGPIWTVGGQSDILDQMTTVVEFGDCVTALDAIKKLVQVRYGVDFFIKFTDAGFEIFMFSLTADDQSAAGVTMPKNPNTVQVNKSDNPNIVEMHIVETAERRVDKVRVQGKRIVVCGSLYGVSETPVATIVGKWASALETEYITPGGSDAVANDLIRKRDRYREVYQHFGAPLDFDKTPWNIQMDDTGNISASALFQSTIRETLHWIPLKEGFTYDNGNIVDNTLGQNEPDIKPPLAWITDTTPIDGGNPRTVQCDLVGIGLGVPHNDWGVFLNASPNHLLAAGLWNTTQINSSLHAPRYDPLSVSCTIAIESDYRIQLAYTLPDGLAAGDGSEMVIHDDLAEYWVMLPDTITDVDATFGVFVRSGPKMITLRDDTQRLAMLLAGAVSRYVNERIRAQIVYRGFQPWSDLLGSILTGVQQGDDIARVGAPITSVEFILSPEPKTTIKTGYA